MKKAIILFLIITVIIFASDVLIKNSNKSKINEKIKENNEFKTFTSAVCEEKGDFVYCKDELYVNCSGAVSKASEIKECNGFGIDNKATGFAVFESSWIDPRK